LLKKEYWSTAAKPLADSDPSIACTWITAQKHLGKVANLGNYTRVNPNDYADYDGRVIKFEVFN